MAVSHSMAGSLTDWGGCDKRRDARELYQRFPDIMRHAKADVGANPEVGGQPLGDGSAVAPCRRGGSPPTGGTTGSISAPLAPWGDMWLSNLLEWRSRRRLDWSRAPICTTCSRPSRRWVTNPEGIQALLPHRLTHELLKIPAPAL